ncbi:MAG: cytochrome bd-I oxidase subunit CydX [Pseudomonadota bacterium]|jgi:cyd operon protein YbgT
MWYFAWILGVGFAASFAIINAMWLESVCDIDTHGIDQSCDSLSQRNKERMQ